MSKQGTQLSEADQQEYHKLREEVSKRSSVDQLNLDNLRRQRKTETEAVNSLKGKFENGIAVNNLESEAQNMNERKTTLNDSIKSTSKDIDRKKKELNSLQSERLKVSQMRTELEEKLQVVLKKLLEADDGKKQNEREVRAKELISTLKRIFPGVKGRVGDLCRPKQRKYAEAVSTVLGRHFDAIVVDNEKTAKECIQHLRDQRAGQATFIPLETIQVKAFNSHLKGMHRNMRPAIETVDFDDSVSRAISYACGNSIVCDDLATAKHLCYEKNVDAKAVTLDGTVIHKGGLMTGGRGPQQNASKRWDDTEVENLYKLKDKLMNDLANLPKSHRRGTEEETLQGELFGLEQRLSYSKDELKALERNIKSKRSELDFVKRQLEDLRPKYTERKENLDELDQTIENSQTSVSKVEDEIYRNFCKRLGYENIREYEAQQGSLHEEAAQKKLEFTTQKSRIENQLSFEKQRIQTTIDRVSGLEAQYERDMALIEELKGQQEKIRSQLDEFSAELELLREELEKQKGFYAESAENLAEQRRELQKRSKHVEAALKNVSALEAEIQRNSSSRYTLLRRCKLEDIDIPLTNSSNSLDKLPIDDLVQAADPDAMDVDEADGLDEQTPLVQDYGIEVDFDSLGETLKEVCIQNETITKTPYANLTH